ncbi:nucleotide sugar dehydrogenase [Sporosarcina sp. P33]|uniref:nucleotide sugar dehydrogenase n=1 Tax=Sporosarcina sp. P33 TaxID=1930764 RepID=UPI0009BFEB6D|nr:nucleotide sugar dehydrogenase [Sporosarcina sp. P33]ARD48424.1 UDP-N-acetyl-D-galactosamine dehydrogenase [Sporosarcina sp. P33]
MANSLCEQIADKQEKIAVVGLGYVGLPVAIAFSEVADVIGFDISEKKIAELLEGIDMTGDVGEERIQNTDMLFTSDEKELQNAKFFVIAVPTPIQSGNLPDLKFLQMASQTVGRNMKKGSVVVYESTVYPGVTEEVCILELEKASNLKFGTDFTVGYSPERINPGDQVHRLENIIKIVSGSDEQTLETIANVYEMIIDAGVYRAECIKVAEAAKVIENAQRDINIAFMNELSMLFNQMKIDTQAVLRAAKTKWNFLPFTPGLVGGHCIGIDPYYLTYKAEDCGYHSKILLAGRHINDSMAAYISQQILKMLAQQKVNMNNIRIGILGLTFKEDCPDFRNTKVLDIINELKEYGIDPIVADPMADSYTVKKECDITLVPVEDFKDLHAVVVAVPHEAYRGLELDDFQQMFKIEGAKLLVDVKGIYNKKEFEDQNIRYWSL